LRRWRSTSGLTPGASAFVCCRKALGRLYEGEIPDRGDVSVTVHARPDDEVFGVIGDIFGYITGARGSTGFKGLDGKFCRRDLLAYSDGVGALHGSFTFARLDNSKKVNARIQRENFPTVPGQDELENLMRKALQGNISHDDGHKFQDLWMERVRAIVLDERDVDKWLLLCAA
jgi:hypothetical protein